MTKNPVSACFVTYNEAHRIYDTLAEVEPYVAEIVVVDQESTDGTTLACHTFGEEFNIPVIILPDHHWGYCEPSRFYAHKASTQPWVLVLDADERISPEFGAEIPSIIETAVVKNYRGCRLKRSLWVGGEHRFTGDYQYRFFERGAATYLNEIHTEPQPKCSKDQIYSPEYIGIYHEKSWGEQIRDELSYEEILISEGGISGQRKRELNVHLALLREKGITPEEADAMTIEERKAAGIGAG